MSNPGVDNLIEYWPLNEASGDALAAHDSKTLSDQNGVGSGAGLVYEAARQFTFANAEYFERAADADLCLTGDFAFCWWSYLDSLGAGAGDYRQVAGVPNTFAGGWEAKFAYNSALAFGVKRDGLWQYGHITGISAGQWDFFAVWYDATAETLRASKNDGTPVTVTSVPPPNAYSAKFFLGGPGSADYFDGRIGPLALFDRQLTAEEITWLHNGGAGRAYAELSGSVASASNNRIDLALGVKL